jgi:multiple sugar transport system permease protein
MKSILMFGAVIQITASFTVADVATGLAGFPSVEYAAHTVVTHMIDFGMIRFEMGYASAMAWVLLIIIASVTALLFASSKKWVYYDE